MKQRNRRQAFTLIELLLVIAIIAILVSLTAAGVMQVLQKVPETQTRTDISEMEAALAAFMTDYNLSDPPPSYLILREDMAYNLANPLEAQSANFLRKTFGKNLGASGPIDWNGDGTLDGPWILEGEQCLVFYLGGIPGPPTSTTPACLGFSTNNLNPSAPGGKRNGPYFPFNASRLVSLQQLLNNPKLSSSFYVYLDPWKAKPIPKPYVYFSSSGINNAYNPYSGKGGDCATIGAFPYFTGTPPQVSFMNANKYQIISAGKDGTFGNGQLAADTSAVGAGADDQANFAAKVLGAGQ
jgi:prepilin-type N-terminal cleavage/methylation domain-containing protein